MKTYAIISTEKGDMKAELYADETPGTVANFVDLAEHGFYDGLTFHRVIPDFVIQGGCPRGDGTGGPGYTIKCETSAPRQRHDRGVLSMAHAGKDTGGSQFFICMNRENTQHLDGVHTCFGQVVEGLDVIDDIRHDDRIQPKRIHQRLFHHVIHSGECHHRFSPVQNPDSRNSYRGCGCGPGTGPARRRSRPPRRGNTGPAPAGTGRRPG